MKKQQLFMVLIALTLLGASCSKKKKKTTPANTPGQTQADKNKACNCPKFTVCATKQRVKNIRDRCTPWQKSHFGTTEVHRKDIYLGTFNPQYIRKYLRNDGTLACRETDLNGDGLPDIFYFFDKSGLNILEIQQDFDYDGIIDLARIFQGGLIKKELYNTDGNENTWEVVKIFVNGTLSQISASVLNPFSKDHPSCPSYNYWEYFDIGTRQLRTVSYDNDCDGKPDIVMSAKGTTGHLPLRHEELLTYKKMSEQNAKEKVESHGKKSRKTKSRSGKSQSSKKPSSSKNGKSGINGKNK